MLFSILVLMASFVYVLGLFEDINPRKRKLVRYALDVKKVEFGLLQDLESHGSHYMKVRVRAYKIL